MNRSKPFGPQKGPEAFKSDDNLDTSWLRALTRIADPVASTYSYIKPNPWDVLLGRGRGNQKHPGNVAFLQKIDCHFDLYHKQPRGEKREVVRMITDWIHQRGGSFLKQTFDGKWTMADNEVAEKKVAQAFRRRQRLNATSNLDVGVEAVNSPVDLCSTASKPFLETSTGDDVDPVQKSPAIYQEVKVESSTCGSLKKAFKKQAPRSRGISLVHDHERKTAASHSSTKPDTASKINEDEAKQRKSTHRQPVGQPRAQPWSYEVMSDAEILEIIRKWDG